MRNAFIAVDMDGAATVDFNDFKVIGSIKCSFLHILHRSLSLYGNKSAHAHFFLGNF